MMLACWMRSGSCWMFPVMLTHFYLTFSLVEEAVEFSCCRHQAIIVDHTSACRWKFELIKLLHFHNQTFILIQCKWGLQKSLHFTNDFQGSYNTTLIITSLVIGNLHSRLHAQKPQGCSFSLGILDRMETQVWIFWWLFLCAIKLV